MTSLRHDIRYALDPGLFAEEVLGLVLDDWQAKLLRSTSKRDLLNCSRQAGKSTITAALGLWTSLYTGKSLVLLCSPSERQSKELFRKIREFMEKLPARPTLAEDNILSVTIKGAGRIAALPGSEATIRGYSAPSLIVIDEASRVEDNLYEALRPMLATSAGRLIAMSTPHGKRGWWHDAWIGSGNWTRVKVTAHDVPRISKQFLAEEQQALPDWVFRQEYLCEFSDTIDSAFAYEDVMNAVTDEVKPLFERVSV